MEGADARIGRAVGARSGRQVQTAPVEQACVVVYMGLQQRVVGRTHRLVELARGFSDGVGAEALRRLGIYEARCCGEDQHGFARAFDANAVPLRHHAAARQANPQSGSEAHALAVGVVVVDDGVLRALVVRVHVFGRASGERQTPGIGVGGAPQRRGESASEVQRAPRGLELHHDGLRRVACESGSLDQHVAGGVDRVGDGLVQVETPLVAHQRTLALELDQQIAQRKVRLGVGSLKPTRQVVHFGPTPGKQRVPHQGQGGFGRRVRAVDGAARPERVFVELEPLLLQTPEDHRSQATVADRQGFLPRSGGLVVPEQVGGDGGR